MAGHKGYGIALLIEILAAMLTGAAMLDEVKSWILSPAIPAGLGHAFVVINPAAIIPFPEFQARIDQMIRKIRSSPKAKNSVRIYLPGEIEWERRRDALANGIALPDNVLEALYGTGQDLNIDICILDER
jgi:LDH2 family malate/lactate/ureidoglycolate dehydrogenase